MNLEELKRTVDFFFENANRYGKDDAWIIEVGVIIDDGKAMAPLVNAMIDPNFNKFKLLFKPLYPLERTPEKPQITPEEQSEIDKLKKSLRMSEALNLELRSANKKLKKKIEKLEKDGQKDGQKEGQE